MNKLIVTHKEGGFFSCSTVCLLEIISYINKYKVMPDIDRSVQYGLIKPTLNESRDITPMFFTLGQDEVDYSTGIKFNYDCMSIQFGDYAKLPMLDLYWIMDKYFTPSGAINTEVQLQKYAIKLTERIIREDCVSVVYRGNDKSREMKVASHEMFIEKGLEIRKRKPYAKFIVLPDECSFKKDWLEVFPDSIMLTPCIDKSDSAVFYEIPQEKRLDHAKKFFASILIAAECSEVITHSGNVGLWTILYRGNTDNVHQIFNDKWY